MAFKINDPADLATLKTELTTDPVAVGYNLNGTADRLTFLVNDPDSNIGAAGRGETIEREFDGSALMDALVPTDFDSPQTVVGAPNYVHILIEFQAYGSIAQYKPKLRSMFAANSATVQALDAQVRNLSRAEVLFGVGTQLSVSDVVTARDS